MENKKVETVVVGLDALVDYIREKDDIIQHFDYVIKKKDEEILKLKQVIKENGIVYYEKRKYN